MIRLLAVLAYVLVSTAAAQQLRSFEHDIITQTFGFDERTPHEVPLAELHQGCPARDCIASLDAPRFVAAPAADFLTDDDLVLALTLDGQARAYPTRILDHHEIVNDTLANTPIVVSYCPLCGSGLVFRRLVDGKSVEFGVSGLLFNSGLVLYDRTTNTLWDQIEGKGIVGPRAGQHLEMLPVTMTRWRRWRDAHPETTVLSAATGFGHAYDKNLYPGYATSDRIAYPVAARNAALHPKTVVYGVQLESAAVAWPETLVRQHGRFEDLVGDHRLTVVLHTDGAVQVTDTTNGVSLTPVRLYWFAWTAFHPDTLLRTRLPDD